MKNNFRQLLVLLVLVVVSSAVFASDVSPKITEIMENPKAYMGQTVSLTGFFSLWKNAPGAPPISRSDWVLCDANKHGIYCNGPMPMDEETGEIESYWKPIIVLGKIEANDEGKPYVSVTSTAIVERKVERMVSVREILLNQAEIRGEYVGLMGVLAKGYDVKGNRMYLVADPTGAIKIGRTQKLYPKGTILHIRGIVTTDEFGVPMIDQIEVVSAKVD